MRLLDTDMNSRGVIAERLTNCGLKLSEDERLNFILSGVLPEPLLEELCEMVEAMQEQADWVRPTA